MPHPADEQFVSEPIEPLAGSADTAAMSRGEPGLPGRFRWRGCEYAVASIVSVWKTSTPERGEMYLRRHWYTILTACGRRMTLYCERQARNRRRPGQRWWLYTMTPVPAPPPAPADDRRADDRSSPPVNHPVPPRSPGP